MPPQCNLTPSPLQDLWVVVFKERPSAEAWRGGLGDDTAAAVGVLEP